LGEPDEVVAADHLRCCRQALDELTGRVGTEEMLDALFGTFCIGK
jgi:tRNA modification GTPase